MEIGSRPMCGWMTRCTSEWNQFTCTKSSSLKTTRRPAVRRRNPSWVGGCNATLEPRIQVCCTARHGRRKKPQQRHRTVDHYGRVGSAGDLLVQEVTSRELEAQ